MRKFANWCPNGCGKSILCTYEEIERGTKNFIYKCDRCKQEFKKKELK